MKTRIISAAVMISIVIAVLVTGYVYSFWIITGFLLILSVAATFEILHCIVKTGNFFRKAAACLYAAAAFFSVSDILHGAYDVCVSKSEVDVSGISSSISYLLLATMIYILFFTLSLITEKKDFDIKEIMALLGAPFMYSAAFATLDCIITRHNGIYYLLLVINFSSICDTGAYFTGVTIGRHKLCEHVSPKKTVEGAVGGIVLSLAATVAIMFGFGAEANMPAMLGITVIMCGIGMLGDLFASAVKRSVGEKDFSNLIPGHGGILDRFDSMLFISPAMLALMLSGVIR